MAKPKSWFGKIRARDRFGATRRRKTAEQLQACSAALEGFAERVYATETEHA
nr:Chromate resistance protein ChrB [Streptomyces malaysiense]